jgi:hypothetical protein
VSPNGPTLEQLHQWWTNACQSRDRLFEEVKQTKAVLARRTELARDVGGYADRLRQLAIHLYPAVRDAAEWQEPIPF